MRVSIVIGEGGKGVPRCRLAFASRSERCRGRSGHFITFGWVLKTAVTNGAKELWLEKELTEAGTVDCSVRILVGPIQ